MSQDEIAEAIDAVVRETADAALNVPPPRARGRAAAAQQAAADPPPKKKPGRPKKKVDIAPITFHGIVSAPEFRGDIVELVYSSPALFRKIVQLFKGYEAADVEMIFDHNGLNIAAKDHVGKVTIYVTIDGTQMNLYYCAQPIRVCIKRDILENVLEIIGSSHNKIEFRLKEDYRSVMHVLIHDAECGALNSYMVGVLPVIDSNITPVDTSAYPLHFQLESKVFKAMIANVTRHAHTLLIQKCGNDPLQFTFPNAQRVNWVCVYTDPAKIHLRSAIQADDIFSIGVSLDAIRPFANVSVGPVVYVSAHQESKLSLSTKLDVKENGCAAEVKIFTELQAPYGIGN